MSYSEATDHGPEPPIEDIDARLRCTRCGARGQAQLIRIDLSDE